MNNKYISSNHDMFKNHIHATTVEAYCLFINANRKCEYCFTELTLDNFQADLDIAEAVGGSTVDFDNKVASCDTCNQRKGTKTRAEFFVKIQADFRKNYSQKNLLNVIFVMH